MSVFSVWESIEMERVKRGPVKKLTLVCLTGLPASGKSTLARTISKDGGWVVVEKDQIRKVLEGQGWKWSRENEKDVTRIRDSQVTEALANGISVVSADTNFGKHRVRLENLAKQFGAEFILMVVPTPSRVCLERDAQRGDGKRVGEATILDYVSRYKGDNSWIT